MLTALFAAFLAAIIALSTVDYLNERGQIREWVREETLKALEPVYEEIVANTGSLRNFRSESTIVWDELQKQSRAIRVPESILPNLQSYYGQLRAFQGTYSRAWNAVNVRVYATFESEFRGRIPDRRDTDLASLVMECWSQLVDGSPHQLVLQRDMDRYTVMYDQVARGAPVRNAVEVLRDLKEAISRDQFVVVLQTGSHTRLDHSQRMLEMLRPVLLRPWQYAERD